MTITLRKFEDKPTTLTCMREDDTATFQTYGKNSDFFAVHDLTHFVVETELGYRHAFFGMVAAGRDLHEFRPGDAASFHPEAGYAEMLAGLLTTADGRGSDLSYEEIKSTIDQRMHEDDTPPIDLSEAQLATIREKSAALAELWRELPVGGKLVLHFEPAPVAATP